VFLSITPSFMVKDRDIGDHALLHAAALVHRLEAGSAEM